MPPLKKKPLKRQLFCCGSLMLLPSVLQLIHASHDVFAVASHHPFRFAVALRARGGSTVAAAAKSDDVKTYRMQQQLHLQARSFQLRAALIKRGLDAFQESTEQTVAKPVDWDCALATEDNPMSCLFSFDAEAGAKVVAPINTPLNSTQWITLTALNRLRRNDPTKVDPLWHSQYAVLRTWFRADSPYSLYNHLTPLGALLSVLLDAPLVLGLVLAAGLALGLLLTLPLWEAGLSLALTSPALWQSWHSWSRFLHAPLPLKLMLGQMAWKAAAVAFLNVYRRLRAELIEWECRMWQDSIPLTIGPDAMRDENDDSGLMGIEEGPSGESYSEDEDDDNDDDADENGGGL